MYQQQQGHQQNHHQGQGQSRPFVRNHQLQNGNNQNQGQGNHHRGKGKGAYRASSWTSQPTQTNQQNNGHYGLGVGGVNVRNNVYSSGPPPGPNPLGRSFSMSSFHPPLCAYTPSPLALGFGAWAKGPPPSLGVAQANGHPPPCRGGRPLTNYPPGPGQGFPTGMGPPISSHGQHMGVHSQFPFYYNAVRGGNCNDGPVSVGGSSVGSGPPAMVVPVMILPAMGVTTVDGAAVAPTISSGSSSSSASGTDLPLSGEGAGMKSITGPGVSSGSSSEMLAAGSETDAQKGQTVDGKSVLPPAVPSEPVFRMFTNVSITHYLCVLCCKKNGRLCTGCKHIAYCSEKCQRLHWPEHKWDCDPPVVMDKALALKVMRSGLLPEEEEFKILPPTGDKKPETATPVSGTGKKSRKKRQNTLNLDVGGLSQGKLEFRSKIAQLSENLDDNHNKCSDLGSEDDKFRIELPHDEKLQKPPLPPDADYDTTTNDLGGSTVQDKSKPKERYTGKMLTRREVPPSDLVAAISPIMITCCNSMLTPNPPDSVICLNCTRWYQASLGYRCSICRWPVCSLECEKSYLHSNFECKVFSASNRLPPPLKDHDQFYNDAVLIIRCLLLKDVDPPKFEELSELIEVCVMNEKKEEQLILDKKIITYLKNECSIQSFTEMSDEDLLEFMNVIDVCSIVVQDRIFIQVHDQGKSYYAPKFVFPIKLYVTQDCIPNSKWSIKHSPKFEECFLRIHAAINLPPLTYVTTCFSGDKHVIGSWFQRDLSNSKFKNRCVCSRCRDPTERGSFFSAVRCECNPKRKPNGRNGDESEGYLVPKNPLSPESDWICLKAGCNNVVEAAKMRTRILAFHEEIHNINISEDFYALVHLKYKLEQSLHKNHFLLLKISVICVMLFWGSVRGLPFFSPRYDFFISTINLANEALRIYDYICPGMSIQRARVLFQLQVAYAYRHLRDIRRYMEWGGEKQFLHKQSATPGFPVTFWELIRIQEEAQNVLKTEPYGTMEYEMAVVLQEVIEDQKDLLSTSVKEVNLEMTAIYNLHKIYTRFSNQYYYPAIPIYEDKDIQEFEVVTGPCARHLIEKLNFPF